MKQHLKRNPQHLTEHAWWYEESGGVTVVVEPQKDTRIFKILWRKIRASLKRLEKK